MHTLTHLVRSRLQPSEVQLLSAEHRCSQVSFRSFRRRIEQQSQQWSATQLPTAFVPPPAGLIPLAVAHALAVLALGMIPSTRHIDSRNTAHVAGGVPRDMYFCLAASTNFMCEN